MVCSNKPQLPNKAFVFYQYLAFGLCDALPNNSKLKIMTLFSEAQHKFQIIKEGEDVTTDSFLMAADEIVPFFGKSVFQ